MEHIKFGVAASWITITFGLPAWGLLDGADPSGPLALVVLSAGLAGWGALVSFLLDRFWLAQ